MGTLTFGTQNAAAWHAQGAKTACAHVESTQAERAQAEGQFGGRQEDGMLDAHVVLLTNFIPPYRLPLYRELAARVSRLTVLVSTPMEANRPWDANWDGLNVEVQRTWSMGATWRHGAGFQDRLQVHVPLDTLSRLRRLQPDVVISAELGFRSLLSAVHHWRFPQVPLVLWATVSRHTEQGRGWARQRLRELLLRRADRIIVNGASGASYVRRFGVPAGCIDYVPYTAVPGCFESLSTHRDPRQAHDLVFAGQLVERKGLLPFLEQLEGWARAHPQRHINFKIAGSGPLEPLLRSRPAPDNLHLQWLGELPYEQLAQTLATSGLLVFPSLADEWGLVVNEAMAAGLPVLGSIYSQAVEELCEEGETGWCFRPDDPCDTRRALQRALETPWQQLHAMRLHARERVRDLTPAWAADRLVGSLRAAYTGRTKPASELGAVRQ
jgi:glycosyltransferase involved in cell wall biosynthesis